VLFKLEHLYLVNGEPKLAQAQKKLFWRLYEIGRGILYFLFVAPRIVRKQGPELRDLERHEFESSHLHRGGNGPFQF
jgi:hypothetical protein